MNDQNCLHRALWKSSLSCSICQDLIATVTWILDGSSTPGLISSSLIQNYLIVNHPLVLACKVQGHLLKDFPNFCQESHRESETYLKALLGQVLDPGVVDLAKPVWVTSCVVCIHAPLSLPHQSSALFGISQTYVKLLHTLCCNIIITIITSCWEPASHSVTGISPGHSYLVSLVWFSSPTPSWLYWFHS